LRFIKLVEHQPWKTLAISFVLEVVMMYLDHRRLQTDALNSSSFWQIVNQYQASFILTYQFYFIYDSALNIIPMLGFRLANPCYKYLRALNQRPVWTPMRQETSFAASHALLLATTPSNAVSWKQQLSTTSGVTNVEIAPPIAC
jgi:hypothetical protein